MNPLCTLSFVFLVTQIDSVPLNIKHQVLMESMESDSDADEFFQHSNRSLVEGPYTGPDYVVGSTLNFGPPSHTAQPVSFNLLLKFFAKPEPGETHLEGTFLNSTMSLDDATGKLILNVSTSNFLKSDKFKKTPTTTTVFYSHGFSDNMNTCIDEFVPKYLDLTKNYQVICIDWSHWAFKLLFYSHVAPKSVDVGNYLGKLLHTFITTLADAKSPYEGKIHLMGHSLGAHLVGNMARTYTQLWASDSPIKVDRVTGLDPAGPEFQWNGLGLKVHMVEPSDAKFVDIIHTCGANNPDHEYIRYPRLGELLPLGHADFYPNGGEWQLGCTYLFTCYHSRAWKYYKESITNQPEKYNTVVCSSLDDCNQHAALVETDTYSNIYMGHHAIKPDDRTKYFLSMDGDDNKL